MPERELLFLCHHLPYPPDGGAHIRSYHFLRQLAREYRITALFLYRKATRPTEAAVAQSLEGLRAVASAEAFPIPQEQSSRRLVWDHGRSLARMRVHTVYSLHSRQYASRLQALVREKTFSLVHMDSLDLSGYLPLLSGIPVVCGHHNVESLLLERRAAVEGSFLRNTYLKLQAKLTAKEERRAAGRVSLNVTCSPDDSALFERLAPEARVATIPNGVDTTFFSPTHGDRKGIVFVGGHSWFPNRDGMEWFLQNVFPIVRAAIPDVPIVWVGQIPAQLARTLKSRFNLDATGFVEDIRPFVGRAACMVVPLRVGGGTRLKILDGWAMGKAIVSTSVGCEGLDTSDNINIVIRDSPEAFAQAVVDVVSDERLARRLGESGRATVESTYDWEIVGETIRRVYHGVAQVP